MNATDVDLSLASVAPSPTTKSSGRNLLSEVLARIHRLVSADEASLSFPSC